MAKTPTRPTFKKIETPEDPELNRIIDEAAQAAPVQIQTPKSKGEGGTPKVGRRRKYKEKPIKRTVNVPVDLDEKLVERAEREAAGNVTAIMIRALNAYL